MILSSSRTDIAVLFAVWQCRGEGKGWLALGDCPGQGVQLTGGVAQNKGVTIATPLTGSLETRCQARPGEYLEQLTFTVVLHVRRPRPPFNP